MEEGEIYDSNDSDHDNNNDFDKENEEEIVGQRVLLPFDDHIIDVSGIANNGEQYLAIVRHERSRLPRTLSIESELFDGSFSSNPISFSIESPSNINISEEWQDKVIQDFLSDRECILEEIGNNKNEIDYHSLFPILGKFLKEGEKFIFTLEKFNQIYRTLLCIDPNYLYPSQQSLLRALVRLCILQADKNTEKEQSDNKEKKSFDPLLLSHNLLIIVGIYFHQHDLLCK